MFSAEKVCSGGERSYSTCVLAVSVYCEVYYEVIMFMLFFAFT